jgi:hypothetical protein
MESGKLKVENFPLRFVENEEGVCEEEDTAASTTVCSDVLLPYVAMSHHLHPQINLEVMHRLPLPGSTGGPGRGVLRRKKAPHPRMG